MIFLSITKLLTVVVRPQLGSSGQLFFFRTPCPDFARTTTVRFVSGLVIFFSISYPNCSHGTTVRPDFLFWMDSMS